MAAWSSQIGAKIFARRLLDQPVVLFRNEDGEVLAFEDKCPHRFAPLRFGKRTTDGIECGYHGLRFDRKGVCAVHIVTPETSRTTHYFYGSCGEYSESEAWIAEQVREAQTRAFMQEDNPMIEAMDEQMQDADFWSLHPTLLGNDVGSVRVRRQLEELIAEEQSANPHRPKGCRRSSLPRGSARKARKRPPPP